MTRPKANTEALNCLADKHRVVFEQTSGFGRTQRETATDALLSQMNNPQ